MSAKSEKRYRYYLAFDLTHFGTKVASSNFDLVLPNKFSSSDVESIKNQMKDQIANDVDVIRRIHSKTSLFDSANVVSFVKREMSIVITFIYKFED